MHSIHSCARDARHSAPARRASLIRGAGSWGASIAVTAGGEEFVARGRRVCVCLSVCVLKAHQSLRVTVLHRRLATRGGRGKTRGGRGGGGGRWVRSGRRVGDRWGGGRGRDAGRRARARRRRRREDDDETRGRRRARVEEGSMKGGWMRCIRLHFSTSTRSRGTTTEEEEEDDDGDDGDE